MDDLAFQRLKRMVAAESEPKLLTTEVEDLLSMFQMPDKSGNLPSDENWKPTYNLRRAAAEGWRWKAAKASELVSADLDGERLSSNQIFNHCQEMIKTYSRRGAATLTIGQ